MRLNHLDLQVPDVQATARFFTRYFGFTSHAKNHDSPAIAMLAGQDGFVLVLQRRKRDTDTFPEDFHLGFLQDSEGPVLAFHERVKADGLEVSDVLRNNRGTLVYCRAPGGFLVEVSCRPGAV
ncbi:VOC family protein [Corallococcus sicarius]|uniref:VOC family protein n=1 Tax=Corallococcus sicarius TaxID=2316726 RepID=A0A3A8NHL1_9BACT|nr:VOC family protein [Corallococcus sicarius]RKH39452.1 VOC family protein [Corallococcus sicarius]